MKFLGYTLADPSIPLPAPKPEMYERMGALVEDAIKAGVLLATGGLAPVERGHQGQSTTAASSRCWTARSPRPRSWSAAGR